MGRLFTGFTIWSECHHPEGTVWRCRFCEYGTESRSDIMKHVKQCKDASPRQKDATIKEERKDAN